MTINCGWCGTSFTPLAYELKRGNGKFCSKICSARHAASERGELVKVRCAYCGVAVFRKKSWLKRSKTGLVFCSRDHKNKFQKSEKRNRDNPVQVNYRKIAFDFYEPNCHDCGYDAVKEILQVHHLDRNRKNNSIENLIIVCPNCHAIRHRKL